MLRLFVAALALIAGRVAASKNHTKVGLLFGGNTGRPFSDMDFVLRGQTVTSIKIRYGERVDGVGLGITQSSGKYEEMYHGGNTGNEHVWSLSQHEIITAIECHWRVKDGEIRIFYIEFMTSDRLISGGIPTRNIGSETAPSGHRLGGLYGTSGAGLNSVGAIWTRLE
ncbi:unnamed protein product [Peronospora farinosa]|uniref:Jacalin-type lectin domain-containing protein n=1 Tax=Peronospora farinosa TaxID=134698 RepID=A0AAV0SYC2_9STRA|nr:unnamed protein product [Peronospora farinosa]CAI5709044.1 unnamed protein product [Peronospora farinosa]